MRRCARVEFWRAVRQHCDDGIEFPRSRSGTGTALLHQIVEVVPRRHSRAAFHLRFWLRENISMGFLELRAD